MLISGSILPASGSTGGASAIYVNTVMSASANNQTLVGLDINPTFNNGAFTGVNQYALRVTGNAIFNNTLYVTQGLRSFNDCTLSTSNTAFGIVFQVGSTNYLKLYGSSGNITLQNGGTFTDNGSRLQISGSIQASGSFARAQTILTTLSASANSDNLIGLDIAPNYAGGIGSTNTISNAGSGYATGSYTLVPLTGGSGTGATASIVASGSITSVTVTSAGSGYYLGDVLSASNTNLGGAGSGFTYTVNTLNFTGVKPIGLRVDGINIGRGGGYVSSNTVVGNGAGQSNTTGISNTFIGYQAGLVNTTGQFNTFIGNTAGLSTTTGVSNSALGYQALLANTTGGSNSALGNLSLFFNSTGGSNTGVGHLSLFNNTTGSNNVALGQQAGRFIADGATSATIVNNSILIGQNTKVLADNQTNQIVIGYNTTGNGSNTTVIGNSSTTATRLYGNLLLGTNTDAGYTLNIAVPSISGSLFVSGSTSLSGSLNVSGNITTTGTITAQTLVVQTITSSITYSSGSNIFGNALTDTQTMTGSVNITGSLTLRGDSILSGSLIVTGSLTGSNARFSGIVTVQSASFDYGQNLSVSAGAYRVIASEATSSFRCAFFDYVMFSGSIVRAGTVTSTWSGSVTEYYENYTADLGGSTSGVVLQTAISSSAIQLQASSSTSAWTIRSLIRLL